MANGKPLAYNNSLRNFGIVGVIFAMMGFLMLFGAGLWAHSVYKFKASAVLVEGEVIDLLSRSGSDSTTYAPKYRFMVNEQQVYTVVSRSSSNPPAYDIGEKVPVLYDPTDPMDARIDGFLGLWFGPTLVAGMGTVFSLVALIPGILYWRRRKDVDYLMRQGMPVMAEFQRVEQDDSDKKGNTVFYIIARWHERDVNQVHVYRSEPLGFDPSEFLSPKQLITVLVHRQKPDVYFVDTSFLPQQRV
ncbi:hypothetical protein NBRC116587_04510 [Pseudoteredinibacter isoporae]